VTVSASSDVVESRSIRPASLSLEQNVPNPFDGATTITFALPHSAFITLAILNSLGQEVVSVLSEEREAGTHSITYSADGLPSGIYSYRLSDGTGVAIGKMVVAH
jgi:hypothetical protein